MKKILFLCVGMALSQIGRAQNSAEVISISAPSSVAPGATFSATIVMTNTSFNPWTANGVGPNTYALGSEVPTNNTTWGLSRIPLPSDPINSGQTATFTANFTAPTAPGIYNFSWRMVQEGVEFFGSFASQTIKVGSPQFVAGDLVVMQEGDGFRTIANTGNPLFLNAFSVSGLTNRFQIAIPITGSNAIIGGLSQFSGMIDLTSDKQFIVVGGYNTNLGGVANLEAANSPRGVSTVGIGGNYQFGAQTT
ncbi:MAG: NBR1-Ig-like domain-containing protein, partial [Verrucomicrobiota bacterium]